MRNQQQTHPTTNQLGAQVLRTHLAQALARTLEAQREQMPPREYASMLQELLWALEQAWQAHLLETCLPRLSQWLGQGKGQEALTELLLSPEWPRRAKRLQALDTYRQDRGEVDQWVRAIVRKDKSLQDREETGYQEHEVPWPFSEEDGEEMSLAPGGHEAEWAAAIQVVGGGEPEEPALCLGDIEVVLEEMEGDLEALAEAAADPTESAKAREGRLLAYRLIHGFAMHLARAGEWPFTEGGKLRNSPELAQQIAAVTGLKSHQWKTRWTGEFCEHLLARLRRRLIEEHLQLAREGYG